MRIVKPVKIPALTRVVEVARKYRFHVAAIIGFPLGSPRALIDEMRFWQAVTPELGAIPLDDGITKVKSELLVAGRCFAPEGKRVTASFVRARLGGIDKRLAVLGDRHWTPHGFTEPLPFTDMPVDWAHALGGPKDPANPYGMGREDVERGGQRVRPLPNVERYDALIRSPNDKPRPACFLPMDVTFGERRGRAGTYGFDYAAKWAPGMPPDLDATFFNVAPSDQWANEPFTGTEAFLVENMHPTLQRIEGALPGLTARVFVTRRDGEVDSFVEIPVKCDTVWLFPSAGLGAVILHGGTVIGSDDAAEIRDLVIACEEIGQPRSIEHYRGALARRMDKDKAAIASISDSDLMPARESGVAPNVTGMDIMGWIRSENLHAKNLRRGAERDRERRREEVLADGLDPAKLGLDQPLPEDDPVPLDDMDELSEYLERTSKKLDEEEEKARKIREEADVRMRAKAREMEIDEDALSPAEGEEAPVGPPQFTASAQLQQYAELAEVARRGGAPNEELEALLGDPAFHAQLERLEVGARDGYRASAHLTNPAPPMTAEASMMARVVMEAARESNEPLTEKDLTGADFHGLDLSGMVLAKCFLEGADLRGANLSGADLSGAVLARADLTGANLTGAKLKGANLGKSNLTGAVLDEADLSESVLMGATVSGARFSGANLERADALQVSWDGADLSGARLSFCTFVQVSFNGTSLRGANLERTTFLECQLDGADLSGARASKATFMKSRGAKVKFVEARFDESVAVYESAFPEADFTDATLEKSCLRTTDLSGARFDRAQMSMTDLSEADARGAVFDRAVMKNAMLVRTRLDDASLRGCNLTEALLSKSQIAGADFTGSQLCRADFSGARGDQRTSFSEAGLDFVRFDRHSAPLGGAA
ncbi:MAG: DUF2169 domain-containing protein [Polyangiaceae bacterium]